MNFSFMSEILLFFMTLFFLFIVILYIYDRYIQRNNSLFIIYPVLGHLRYFFQWTRKPFKQYMGDEKYYQYREKVNYVYQSSEGKQPFVSFSPEENYEKGFLFKSSVQILNDNEINKNFNISIGNQYKYILKSPIIKSGMRDGSISPEAIKSMSLASYYSNFMINTGEGGLTSNFISTHKIPQDNNKYLTIIKGTKYQKYFLNILKKFTNKYFAITTYKNIVLYNRKDKDTFLLDNKTLNFFRINFQAKIEDFPTTVPKDIPNMILQIGTGKYSVRTKDGLFDYERYEKVMKFCQMTEIKIAQGAKQTGGKLSSQLNDENYSYYYNTPFGLDIKNPNKIEELKDLKQFSQFIKKIKNISKKPVGIKIVISSIENIEDFIKKIKEYHLDIDFITIDGGDGGSAKASIDTMQKIGLDIFKSTYILNKLLKKHALRDKIKIISGSKILTADDIITLKALGADVLSIGRAFMMSIGCIRAGECGNLNCPVGIATMNVKKRKAFFISKQSKKMSNYYNQLIQDIYKLMMIINKKDFNEIDENILQYLDKNKLYSNIHHFFEENLN